MDKTENTSAISGPVPACNVWYNMVPAHLGWYNTSLNSCKEEAERLQRSKSGAIQLEAKLDYCKGMEKRCVRYLGKKDISRRNVFSTPGNKELNRKYPVESIGRPNYKAKTKTKQKMVLSGNAKLQLFL